jgi:hypothetical protein
LTQTKPKPSGLDPNVIPAAVVDPSADIAPPSLWIYGDSGNGKTHLLGSGDDVLSFSIASEQGHDVLTHGGGSNVRAWPVKTGKDLRVGYRWLYERYRAKGADVWPRIVGVDSFTHLQDLWTAEIVAAEHKANPAKRDPDIPAPQDYLRVQLRFKKLVDHFNALPCIKVYTAAMMYVEVTNPDTGEDETLHLPMVTSKEARLSMLLAGKMRIISALGVAKGGKQRVMINQRTGNWYARDRTGKLPARLLDPSLPDILQRIGAQ